MLEFRQQLCRDDGFTMWLVVVVKVLELIYNGDDCINSYLLGLVELGQSVFKFLASLVCHLFNFG
jgi:hypothetical protein